MKKNKGITGSGMQSCCESVLIGDLPFSRIITNNNRYQIKNWDPILTGDPDDDRRVGELYARKFIEWIREESNQDDAETILAWIIRDMRHDAKHEAVNAGFFKRLTEEIIKCI